MTFAGHDNQDISPYRGLAAEYEAICDILERECTVAGVDRFVSDMEWRNDQRERANEALELERSRSRSLFCPEDVPV